jgi:hypothetical protein
VLQQLSDLGRETGAERIDLIYPDQIAAHGAGRSFTWEQPQHSDCRHERLGEAVAVKPDGAKLVFCRDCNLLEPIRPKVGS